MLLSTDSFKRDFADLISIPLTT